ncbi:hypothetical protein V9T40_004179 [Parthenolecanium corni]|uniref:Uncharacterized protein n=1 Tax=Parthenolecanium corni TaxID=536013 RepID=A0AAN9Y9B8_9HEMI
MTQPIYCLPTITVHPDPFGSSCTQVIPVSRRTRRIYSKPRTTLTLRRCSARIASLELSVEKYFGIGKRVRQSFTLAERGRILQIVLIYKNLVKYFT